MLPGTRGAETLFNLLLFTVLDILQLPHHLVGLDESYLGVPDKYNDIVVAEKQQRKSQPKKPQNGLYIQPQC